MECVLADLRVIDASRFMGGALTAMMLAEAGAHVTRTTPTVTRPAHEQAFWNFVNRSKHQESFDTTNAYGVEQLHKRLADAAMLVHDLTPSEALALGLNEPALKSRHPQLIAVAVTGFPAGHPEQETPALDSLVMANLGVFDEQQPVRRSGPTFLRFPMGSWGAAWLAAIGAVARLIALDRGAVPGAVRTSLAQGALLPLSMHWYRAEKPSTSLRVGFPKAADVSLFRCADDVWLHIMTNADRVPLVQQALATLPEHLRTPVSDGSAFRTVFPLFDAYKAVFPTRPSSEWLTALRAADIAVQPVLDIGQLYDDEQVAANELMATVESSALGRVRQPAVPVAMSPPFRIGRNESRPPPVVSQRKAGSASPGYPLEGLKILDLGTHLAGPLAPMLAADLGAEVIKLEAPSGDSMRWVEWCFLSCQRGKRSIALQLKDKRARPVLERLVRWADVVHHNMRMPAAKNLGLDFDTLRSIQPSLVYTHVSAYGAHGPQKDWPGFDQLFQASSGWEKLCAGEDNPPTWLRFGPIDHQVALASLYGTLLAVRHRNRTGKGQFVSASLLGAALFTCAEVHDRAGQLTPVATLDPLQLGIDERHRLYSCVDGWVLLFAQNEEAWRGVLQIAGCADTQGLQQTLSQVPVSRALMLLRAGGAKAVEARTNQCAAFFDSQANTDIGLTLALDHPVYGRLETVGRYLDFPDMYNRIHRAPPTIGQHSREIMTELGMAEGYIQTLFEQGIVA